MKELVEAAMLAGAIITLVVFGPISFYLVFVRRP